MPLMAMLMEERRIAGVQGKGRAAREGKSRWTGYVIAVAAKKDECRGSLLRRVGSPSPARTALSASHRCDTSSFHQVETTGEKDRK